MLGTSFNLVLLNVERNCQVDGVTRCLARLLSHLKEEGHSVVVLGPQNGMVSVAPS